MHPPPPLDSQLRFSVIACANSVHELATHPAGVLGPLRDIVGPDVDFLYTKVVWKDADIQTGFGWHWDHTYWGGAPKFSTWLALDDANEANGCLKLVGTSYTQAILTTT